MRKGKTLWCLDVDGVLTDPKTKRLSEPRIISFLQQRAALGDVVALNSGRSISWLERQVLPTLVKAQPLDYRIFVVGEKGGTWCEYGGARKTAICTETSYSVPPALKEKVRTIVIDQFQESSFFDESKQTMISIEMNDGFSPKKFAETVQQLESLINPLLCPYPDLTSEKSIIAFDIQHKHAGKGEGAKRILEWISATEPETELKQAICVGDSTSDLSMVEPFLTAKLSTLFVYVGESELQKSSLPAALALHRSQAQYCQGFSEFVEQYESDSFV